MKFPGTQHRVFKALEIALISLMLYVPLLRAQEPQIQQLTAPPPVKVISMAEREQMNEAREPKARIRLTIELAENHLLKAEQETTQHNYESASSELGRYWSLIENGLAFLRGMTPDRNKTRDLYKRLELALRAHGPRLTSLRRTTPLEYAVWIKEVEDVARKARTDALNSFYGDTVFRERQQKPVNRPNKEPNKNAGLGDKPR